MTKRCICSDIAKLYDPIGWLDPIVIRVKVLIKNLWIRGDGSDDSLPKELQQSSLSFKKQLADIEYIKIPCCAGSFSSSSWMLHCFCDASERDAAAIYVVIQNKDQISVKLPTAKAEVAPIKSLSFPRFELCSAVISAKLAAYILNKLDRPPLEIHCWSDSKVALAWIQAHQSKYKTFISHRVTEITGLLPGLIGDMFSLLTTQQIWLRVEKHLLNSGSLAFGRKAQFGWHYHRLAGPRYLAFLIILKKHEILIGL